MKSQMTDIKGLKVYKRDLVKSLLNDLLKNVQEEEAMHGADFAHAIMATYLASLVSTIVGSRVTFQVEDPSLSQEERLEKVAEEIGRVKRTIENAVATGFEAGLRSVNPKIEPKFVCEIHCADLGSAGPESEEKAAA